MTAVDPSEPAGICSYPCTHHPTAGKDDAPASDALVLLLPLAQLLLPLAQLLLQGICPPLCPLQAPSQIVTLAAQGCRTLEGVCAAPPQLHDGRLNGATQPGLHVHVGACGVPCFCWHGVAVLGGSRAGGIGIAHGAAKWNFAISGVDDAAIRVLPDACAAGWAAGRKQDNTSKPGSRKGACSLLQPAGAMASQRCLVPCGTHLHVLLLLVLAPPCLLSGQLSSLQALHSSSPGRLRSSHLHGQHPLISFTASLGFIRIPTVTCR